jgi:DNA-binding transcriptional LysR family regulator
MDLEGLHAFLAVIDHGSLLAAAEALGASRSTLRRRVEALEAGLGVPLLLRGRQGADPTPAGEALAREVRPVLAQLAAIGKGVRHDSEDLTGEICVQLPPGMPSEAVALFTRLALDAHPGLELRYLVREEVGEETEADVGLHFGPTAPRGRYLTTVLVRVPERLLASPGWLAEHGAPATAEEVLQRPIVTWRAPGEDGMGLPLVGGDQLRVRPRVTSPDIHLVRQLAVAGVGLALAPDFPFAPGVLGHELAPVLDGVVGRECALRMVVPEVKAGMPRTRKAVRALRGLVGVG